MILDLQKRLDSKQIKVNVTNTAKQFILEHGYDQNYGARPLKRFLQSNVETLIARKIISDEIEPDSVLTIDCKEDKLMIL